MLHVVIGTRAQLIKMAPIMRELEFRSANYRLWLTGQHQVTMSHLLAEFKIATAPVPLYVGDEVKSLGKVIPWAREVMRNARQLMPKRCHGDIFIAHGDTFSTLLGMRLGRKRGARVAHVESGLRSFNWLNPFPEELVRLQAMHWADLAFAPGPWAAANLAASKARVVDTGANTLLDALRYALDREPTEELPLHPGTLFSIHRFETLYSRRRTRLVLDFVKRIAARSQVTFVLHPSTEQRFRDLGCLGELRSTENLELLPRMTYLPFIQLAGRAKVVVTDGGSNQEELSYLSVPTILMRAATERQEGLGENVMLGKFDVPAMESFAFRAIAGKTPAKRVLPATRPSCRIVDELLAMQAARAMK